MESLGEQLPLITAIPFIGMLASIAFIPLLSASFWHRHFGKIVLFWSVIGTLALIYYLHLEGAKLILRVLLEDYVPFILLISTLYVVSCGIYFSNFLSGSPLTNTLYLAFGTPLASIMGTTGASMVLVGPFLRANVWRKRRDFMAVFFIMLVGNIGGSLTPVGDPPLFLGYLKGIPFLWSLNLFWPMLFLSLPLLIIYYLLDNYHYQREEKLNHLLRQGFRVEGLYNVFFLLIVLGILLFTGVVNLGSLHLSWLEVRVQDLMRNLLLLVILLLSHFLTPLELKGKNEFSWFPVKEVAIIFAGLFVTMIPAVEILRSGEKGAFGPLVKIIFEPYHYFWGAGFFSAILDNAPTYLTFLSTLLGKFYPGLPENEAIASLLKDHPRHLLALSCGSVFFGACTYIGNAPNFMIKSIAEERGITMPSFLSYLIKYTIPILLPLFILITILFFKD